MRKLIVMASWLCALILLGSSQRIDAQTSGESSSDKVSQLAEDFCSKVSAAQGPGQQATDQASELAKEFCAQVSRAKSSNEPVRIALAQSASQPPRLGLAQASSEPTRLAAAQVPGGQPTDKTVRLADNLHFTIGYRNWFHSWSSTSGKFSVLSNVFAFDSTNDGIGYIPTAGIRYKDFFISASGFFSNTYTSDLIGLFDQHAKRKEADVNVGYFVHPWIALSVGYKHITQDFTISGFPSFVFHSQFAYNGPTLGASANIPIPEGGLLPSGLSVYGNGAGGYLWTHGNTDSLTPASSIANHAFYGVLEGGLAYKFGNWPIALTAAYKYQSLNTFFKSQDSAARSGRNSQTDVMRGPIVGISYIH